MSNFRWALTLVVLAGLVGGSVSTVYSQGATATLSGVVKDPSGAVIIPIPMSLEPVQPLLTAFTVFQSCLWATTKFE
jgi:hypothetical protein